MEKREIRTNRVKNIIKEYRAYVPIGLRAAIFAQKHIIEILPRSIEAISNLPAILL